MLPLYATEDVVWGKQELKRVAESEQDNVVRYIRLKPSMHYILAELLETAEQTFESFCNDSPIAVIEHTWGLAAAPPELIEEDDSDYEPLKYTSQILPGTVSLVAKVAIIKHKYPYVHDYQVITSAINRHRSNLSIKNIWTDATLGQFVQNDEGIHLVDIEPLFTKRTTL